MVTTPAAALAFSMVLLDQPLPAGGSAFFLFFSFVIDIPRPFDREIKTLSERSSPPSRFFGFKECRRSEAEAGWFLHSSRRFIWEAPPYRPRHLEPDAGAGRVTQVGQSHPSRLCSSSTTHAPEKISSVGSFRPPRICDIIFRDFTLVNCIRLAERAIP